VEAGRRSPENENMERSFLKKEIYLIVLTEAILNSFIFRDPSVSLVWKLALTSLCVLFSALFVLASILGNVNDGFQERVVEHA
jgi:hypothetical protein